MESHSSPAMYTTVSSWIDDRRKSNEKWTKYPMEKEDNDLIIAALKSLLEGKVSGSATAMRLDDILRPRLITGQRAGVSYIWGLVADASRWFGASHTQQLVDLVVAIKQLPDVVNEAGYVVTHGGKVIWREMHDFHWIFYEHGLCQWSPNFGLKIIV